MLIALLREAAESAADVPAVITPARTVAYEQCLAHSERIATGLIARGIERFACQVDDVADLIAVLCASTAVGAEACVYPVAREPSAIADLAERFDHRTIVTNRTDIEGLTAVTVDELAEVAPGAAALPSPPDRAPALILTTGTTGQPKGARHDWFRLGAGVRRDRTQRASRWLLAYNLNQFAGIQVLLHVLTNQATLVVPASNQPRAALESMRDHRVTHASATPTFWRFLIALLDDNAAASLNLEQITLGGEAVPAQLLADLARVFPDARVSQVYASTESGSTVSVRDSLNGLPASVLERTETSRAQMKIVDGELHIRSAVGMLGYYGETDVEAGWQATGDLVEVRDGRIYFVGRASDTINVGGVKVHPLPVEEAACGVVGVQLARAYRRPNPITGSIVALDVVAEADADPEALKQQIRNACGHLPDAAQPRRIRFVETLETDGGKLVRRAER